MKKVFSHRHIHVLSSERVYSGLLIFEGLFYVNVGFIINREFDDGLLQRMPEISYEDDIKSIPSPPDVSNYLVSEVSLLFCFSVSMFIL